MSARFYKCPTCGAAKELEDRIPYARESFAPETQFPADLPCGWRGCMDRAVPAPIVPLMSSEES